MLDAARNTARLVGEIIASRGWHGTAFLVIQGYVDGSNLHADTDIVAVAGCAARQPAWEAWEKKWDELLKLGDLERWHHAEFMAKVRKKSGQPIRNWKEAEWLLARRLLCESFEAAQPHYVGTTVRRKDYEDARTRFPDLPEDPYYFLLDRCMHQLIQSLFGHPKDNGIAVYCDQDRNEALVRQLAQWHTEYLRSNPRYFYPGDARRPIVPAYGSCIDFKPLQAADVVAHELVRFARAHPGELFVATNVSTGSFILDRLKIAGAMTVTCLSKPILEMELDGRAFVPGHPHGYRFGPPVPEDELGHSPASQEAVDDQS
jgi:hypothetical protein